MENTKWMVSGFIAYIMGGIIAIPIMISCIYILKLIGVRWFEPYILTLITTIGGLIVWLIKLFLTSTKKDLDLKVDKTDMLMVTEQIKDMNSKLILLDSNKVDRTEFNLIKDLLYQHSQQNVTQYEELRKGISEVYLAIINSRKK